MKFTNKNINMKCMKMKNQTKFKIEKKIVKRNFTPLVKSPKVRWKGFELRDP